jgi:hypothetical protein
MTMLQTLCDQWMDAKAEEAAAIARRRALEDRLKSLIGIPETLEGTETVKPDGFVIKVEGRINRRVDGDRLQTIAAENGLLDHLPSLFRWTPEINMKVWKGTDPAITTPLLGAITSKPGRPSFTITKEQ